MEELFSADRVLLLDRIVETEVIVCPSITFTFPSTTACSIDTSFFILELLFDLLLLFAVLTLIQISELLGSAFFPDREFTSLLLL